jgi:hypothetical protein
MNTDINKPKTENLAGIKSIKFADISNVKRIENGIIEMKPGFLLKKIETSFGKWTFEGDLSDAAADGYDFKVSGLLSGHDKSILANTIMANAADLLLVIELKDITYAAGNLDEGIHFKFSHYSGAMPFDESGYKLEFYRKLIRAVMVLNSVI